MPELALIEKRIIQYVYSNRSIIREIASKQSIRARDLELQVLLYLPRLIYDNHLPDNDIFINEVKRLSSIIKQKIRLYIDWLKLPSNPPLSIRNTNFIKIPRSKARIIHERFHYLSSYRINSLHFGLDTLDENRLVTLVTLSPFDLEHIAKKLPPEINAPEVLVVSRVFSFDWAPKNASSYIMSRIFKWIKQIKPTIKLLITYINPNIGFTGASYKASNWILLGREWGTRYVYLDGKYITDRELVRRFGTSEAKSLQKMKSTRFEISKIDLVPLLIYVYFLDKELRHRYDKGFKHNFWRP